MVFSGKNGITPEKRHAKVLIFKKEQTFSYFFLKNLKYRLHVFFRIKLISFSFVIVFRKQPTPGMTKFGKSVKTNILLGYIALIAIASATIGLIYNETLALYKNQVDFSPVTHKILITNSILTNLYEAEGLERSFMQTGNRKHYEQYNSLMDSVVAQTEILRETASNPQQRIHADSVLNLVRQKRQNLKELLSIKQAGSSESLYEKAMNHFTANKDSINHLISVYKTFTTSTDSIRVEQRRKKFLERLVHVFSPRENPDSALKVVVNESTRVDSIINTFNLADSITSYLSSIMEDIRQESITFEKQLAKKEREILNNDQTISLQIRQILSMLENEEFVASVKKVELQQKHIGHMTTIIIILGTGALLIVAGFLTLILKDISRSQLYRKNLEKEKAYSESLLKSKEQFMLSITHDLKSPLSSIIGYSRLIEQQQATSGQKHFLRNINQSASYILRLINDLTDFTRLESGKLKIEPKRFNLKLLFHEVLSGFYPLAGEKQLELHLLNETPPGTTCFSDPLRIKQVLGNLISNAIKFTSVGKITVRCFFVQNKGSSNVLQIDVTDTGPGIAPEHSKLIFEEFSRILPESGPHQEGSGLGLNITKRLVELMNGTIMLESTPGKGSCFSVLLPMEQIPENAIQEKPQEKEISFEVNGNPINDLHVLLVDDDPVLLEMAENVLKTANLKVTPFSDPREALKTLQKKSFDLLITDIQMPRMNGFELFYFFRQHVKKPKAIAVTGNVSEPDIFDRAGFSAYLQKPFQPEELLHQVSQVLNGKKDGPRPAQTIKESGEFYSIDALKAFTSDDPEAIRDILVSFTESTIQNVELFKQHLNNEDFKSLSLLAHKMLPLFKQLGVSSVIAPLSFLEQTKFDKKEKKNWVEAGKTVLKNTDILLKKISEDHQFSLSDKSIL